MLSCYEFDPRLVVRTPTFPIPAQIGAIDFRSLLTDELFLEAVYLASPVLLGECLKWRDGLLTGKKEVEKLMRTLTKYYLRMSSRSTPFGLFSGCAVANWSEQSERVVLDSTSIRCHTRLDMHYLCALAKSLAEISFIREKLHFSPNNSLYTIGSELRFVEYLYIDGNRRYRISSVNATDYLLRILEFTAGGKTMPQMVDFLSRDGISEADARSFIDELTDCQLLVSNLEPSITGTEFMDQIITTLESLDAGSTPDIGALLGVLAEVKQRLKDLDGRRGDNIEKYKQIIGLVEKLGAPYVDGRLFQTDLVKHLQVKGLPVNFQGQLREALQVLNKLTLPKGDSTLESFAQRFIQRYENKEMPLMEVLDTEIGIGYEEDSGGCTSPLVEDLRFGKDQVGSSKMDWSSLEVFLHEQLKETLESNRFVFELTEKQLEKFTSAEDDLPPSLAAMFRVIDGNTLYIESVGGSSAVNLLGRFAHADAEINRLAVDITGHEQRQDPDILYAEIAHLPDSRTGNILLHPAFRRYEIPYLAASSLGEDFRIDLKDLFVSVRNGKIILWSKRLGKSIIPRLSTAHNYSLSSLPVYRFLCDLQFQGKKKGLGFNWGSLQQQHRFLPRVMYKNTVLHLARWSFSRQDLAVLLDVSGEDERVAIERLRSKWRMPRFVVLCEGDNELLIDLECPSSVQLWMESIRNKDSVVMREFIAPGNMVTDEKAAAYANQFIAILTRNGSSYPDAQHPWLAQHPEGNEQREFPLGTEWVYFKMYCGVKSADRILTDAVAPMVGQLMEKDLIDKWFFIRYNDPEFHLRIRFHLKNVPDLGQLITIVHSHLRIFESQGYIWKLQTDTYKREMERYGSNAIRLAESVFHYDSMACLQLLTGTAGDARETIRWIWSLPALDYLLDCFSLAIQEKLSLMQDLRHLFGLEFKVDKTVKTQLNNKYRDNRKMIDTVMKGGPDLAPEWEPLMGILAEKSCRLQPVAAEILALFAGSHQEITLRELLGSYIHVMLNRIITTDARAHELVIYDFMARYYKSQVVRDGELKASDGSSGQKPEFVLSNK
jgi:thiopeptide-type bacteriocin biosynthesis protein